MLKQIIVITTVALLSGCASYATPGRGAKMNLFGASPEEQAKGTDAGIQQAMEKKPLAGFPASLAIVRVQAPGYVSLTGRGWGGGQYTILTTRDVERTEDVRRINALPQVRGVAPLNRLVIPSVLNSDYEL